MTSYVLHYAPDNASLIVRLALEEMGLPYQTQLIDRRAQEQQSPAYLALNPAGQIPVLETPHGPISETAAILLWLSETHHMMGPAPLDPARGAFLKWLFFASNSLQAGLRLSFYPEKFVGADPTPHPALRTHMQTVLAGHVALFETLAGAGHDWFAGAEVSVLDYYVATCLRWCKLYPQGQTDWLQLSDFPNLNQLAQRLEQRPAVLAAQQSEGLGPTPFSAPQLAQPSEGSAL